MIDCETETANAFPQKVQIRAKHTIRADVGPVMGGEDSAPDPHDYFETALVACKTLTATWYARKYSLPLERVEAHVERDNSKERAGFYTMKVRLAFHGPLSDEQRKKLYDAVAHCPIHKLMTTTDITIETEPFV